MQDQSFQDRLTRINGGTPPPPNVRKFDAPIGAAPAKPKTKPAEPSAAMLAMRYPMALFLGVFSVIFGWYIQFHLLTGQGTSEISLLNFLATLGGDLAVTLLTVVILGWMLGLLRGLPGKLLALTVLATFFLGPFLVALAPGLFEALFSEQWVFEVALS